MEYHQAVAVQDIILHDLRQYRGKIFLPAFMENVEDSNSPYKISRLTHNSANNNSWQLENTLTYNLHKKDHRLTVMGGFTMQYYRTQYANLFATGLPWEAWKNRNLWYVGQGTSVTGADGGSEKAMCPTSDVSLTL